MRGFLPLGLASPLVISTALLLPACRSIAIDSPALRPALADEQARIDPLARRYVDLYILFGHHDDWTAEGFYGPAAWRDALSQDDTTLVQVAARARQLRDELRALVPSLHQAEARSRASFLIDELAAFAGQAELQAGVQLEAAVEAKRLYFVDLQPIAPAEIDAARLALDRALPGSAPLRERHALYRQRATVELGHSVAVIAASQEECRRRLTARLPLPEDRGLQIVIPEGTARTPGGELQYHGQYSGTVYAPTFEKTLGNLFSTACHEGYLGHYLRALLRERRGQAEGRPELFVWPMITGQLEEGTAEIGPEIVFPPDEAAPFFRDVLAPIAGIEPAAAELSGAIDAIAFRLRRLVGYEGARRLLQREMTFDQVQAFMDEAGFFEPDASARWLNWVQSSAGTYALLYQTGYTRFAAEVEQAVASGAAPDRFAAFLQIVGDPWRY